MTRDVVILIERQAACQGYSGAWAAGEILAGVLEPGEAPETPAPPLG